VVNLLDQPKARPYTYSVCVDVQTNTLMIVFSRVLSFTELYTLCSLVSRVCMRRLYQDTSMLSRHCSTKVLTSRHAPRYYDMYPQDDDVASVAMLCRLLLIFTRPGVRLTNGNITRCHVIVSASHIEDK